MGICHQHQHGPTSFWLKKICYLCNIFLLSYWITYLRKIYKLIPYIDGNVSKPLFPKYSIFREHKKTDLKCGYFFLICGHLHKDTTLGCKYSVYSENVKTCVYFRKNLFFKLYEVLIVKFS